MAHTRIRLVPFSSCLLRRFQSGVCASDAAKGKTLADVSAALVEKRIDGT
jgi:hypothetical protein